MISIDDAPYIRNAERYGTDYTERWYGFTDDDDEYEEDEE